DEEHGETTAPDKHRGVQIQPEWVDIVLTDLVVRLVHLFQRIDIVTTHVTYLPCERVSTIQGCRSACTPDIAAGNVMSFRQTDNSPYVVARFASAGPSR